MKTHQKLRRTAAIAESQPETSGERLTVMDPKFNLRELAKQLILLEDHLFHQNKHCPDCIRKHLLFSEALAEETTTLDTEGLWTDAVEGIAEQCRQWIEVLADGADEFGVAQAIRKVRKKLVEICFDPRKAASVRVAVLHQDTACPHL